MKKIAIVGGHGQVGQEIVKELTRQGYSVVLMGRNLQKMRAFAKLFSPVLEQREVDLAQAVMSEKLADLDMVIVCLDQTDTRFIEQCQNLGIDYLDISANSDFLKKVELLPVPKKSKRVIGLGLAPGVTNLAAAAYVKSEPSNQNIVIDVLLGIGDRHGESAVKWTFDQLNRTYKHPQWSQKTENFVYGRKTDFGPSFGKRRSANFDFADQHMLHATNPSRNYATYLGFDQNWLTALLITIKKSGLAGLFKSPMVLNSLVWFMQRGIVGDRSFVVKVSNGQVEDSAKIVLFGEEEAKMTADIAAFVAKKLLKEAVPNGHYHITELTTLSEVLTQLPRLSTVV